MRRKGHPGVVFPGEYAKEEYGKSQRRREPWKGGGNLLGRTKKKLL